jgi:hypothetical protein
LIENVSMPEEIKKEIFELSRLTKIDLTKLTQMKAAKAMEKAAENPSGTAGAGLGMGMGFAMANQMGNMFSQQQQSTSNNPPPIPQAVAFYVAVNGQQTGPFDVNTLQSMASNNQLSRESLVWRQGMGAWSAAGQVSELASIFNNVPPPIPS